MRNVVLCYVRNVIRTYLILNSRIQAGFKWDTLFVNRIPRKLRKTKLAVAESPKSASRFLYVPLQVPPMSEPTEDAVGYATCVTNCYLLLPFVILCDCLCSSAQLLLAFVVI